MPTATKRINTYALALVIDGVNYYDELTSAVLDNEDADSDTVTFADAAAGGASQYFFTINAVQSLTAGSFWRKVWDNSGSEVAFRYAPTGSATASASDPHFTGKLRIGKRPTLGGDADRSTTGSYTFETRFDVTTGVPTMVTTGSLVTA